MEEKITVNKERLRREFAELVEIDSVSFGERQMADRLKEKLETIGFTVEEDDAGCLIGILSFCWRQQRSLLPEEARSLISAG